MAYLTELNILKNTIIYLRKFCIFVKKVMLLQLNLKNAFQDFEWLIRVLESAKSRTQMDTVLKCFELWEKKHFGNHLTISELSTINRLKSNFWATYKNKNVQFVATSII